MILHPEGPRGELLLEAYAPPSEPAVDPAAELALARGWPLWRARERIRRDLESFRAPAPGP